MAATYIVTSPDGASWDVTAPDGATQEEVMNYAKAMHAKEERNKPQKDSPNLTFAEKYIAPALEQSGIGGILNAIPEKAVRGLVQGGADPSLGAAQFLAGEGGSVDRAIRNQQAQYEASRGSSAGTFDPSRMMGGFVSPLALVGVGGAPAAGALGRIGNGMRMGTIGGASAPVTGEGAYIPEKATQMGIGAALGGALPGAWEGAKALGRTVRNVFQPMMGEWGATQAAGRMANIVAGTRAPQVQQALATSQDFVPGSKLTAGQASVPTNSAEFAALQELAASRNPSVFRGDLGIEGQQQAARQAAIADIAKTPEAIAVAQTERSNVASPLYEAARKGGG